MSERGESPESKISRGCEIKWRPRNEREVAFNKKELAKRRHVLYTYIQLTAHGGLSPSLNLRTHTIIGAYTVFMDVTRDACFMELAGEDSRARKIKVHPLRVRAPPIFMSRIRVRLLLSDRGALSGGACNYCIIYYYSEALRFNRGRWGFGCIFAVF